MNVLLQIAPVDVNSPITKIFEFSISLGILAGVVCLFVWLYVRQDNKHQEQLKAKDEVISKLQQHLTDSTVNNLQTNESLKHSIREVSTYINVISTSIDKGFVDLKQFVTILDSFKSR